MGNALSFSVPASKWAIDDIPDMTGKVVLVTGGNTGIGKETCKALLAKNAKVYLAARDSEKGRAAVDDLSKATGRAPIFLQLDLARLESIKNAASEFTMKESALHVLFNNAGVMLPPRAELTADGYDLQFGTQVLGHHYLTQLLLPSLQAAQPGPARVIFVSSSTQDRHKEPSIDYDSLREGTARAKRSSWWLYCQSKFAVVVLANEYAKSYGDSGVIAISLDPGNIRSDLQRHVPWLLRLIVRKVMLYPTEYGALTQLYAGTSPEASLLNGKFLVPWAREGEPRPATRDSVNGERLWVWLEDQIKDV